MSDPDKTRKIQTIPRCKPLDPRVGLVRALETASMYKPPGVIGEQLAQLIEAARRYAAEAA